RTNRLIQSSFCWKSGSVENSHAIPRKPTGPQSSPVTFEADRGRSLDSMPQQHLDRLSSTDASFLHQEGANSHMHIGGVLVFEGPPPEFGDYLDHIRGRLHLVPRYRQQLAAPPLATARPLWVVD